MAKGNERDDSSGGIGQGGPQRGPTGSTKPQQGGTAGGGGDADGEGQQRHEGGSSRDSENLG